MKATTWSALLAGLLLAGPLLADLAGVVARSDRRFVHGLVDRRLFDLAASECERLLAGADLTVRERVDWVVELIRIHSQRAIHAPPARREPLWQAAHGAAESFLADEDAHSRRVLVLVQDALTWLAQGELARMEAEVAAEPQEALDRARQTIRLAARALEEQDKYLTEQIARVADRSPEDRDGLSAAELFALQNHVRFQFARALRNQALCYPPESDDRLAALSMSIEQLKRTLSQLQSEDPLAWQGYLELAHCYRLLGSLDLSHRTLAAPLGPAAPPEVRMRAVAEAAQLTIAEGQPAEALSNLRLAQDEQTDPAPELDFALLEAILALWETAASDDDQESMRSWQKQAAAVVARIERAHGSYWGRRAALQLMRVADSGSSPGSAEILGHAGDNLYLKGQLDEAVVAYERAAGQARAARDLAAALELESKAASIEQSREQFAAASQRLERLAQEQPDAAEAPRTHLLAAWNAAQDTRVHPDSGPRYVRLLEEHLDRWPTGATADLARLWLGRWHEAHQDWEAAVQAYQGIAADAEPFAEAVPALARCWNQYLARQSAAGEPVDRVAAEAMQFFDALILDSQGQWPASWTAAQRAAAVATAALRIDYLRDGYLDAQRVLQAALRGGPEPTSPWRENAQGLLVVALAGQGDRRDEAHQLLEQLGRESPDQLPEIIHRLAEIIRRQPSMAAQLAPLQLNALQFTDAANLPVDPRQQLRLDRVQAAALAAAGDVDKALEVLRRLAQTHPHHAQVRIDLARLLTSQPDESSLSQAIVQWQQIARRLRPDTPDWYEAKHGLALALFQRNQTNDRSVAAQQLRYLKATSLVDQTPWSKQTNALLQRCEQE